MSQVRFVLAAVTVLASAIPALAQPAPISDLLATYDAGTRQVTLRWSTPAGPPPFIYWIRYRTDGPFDPDSGIFDEGSFPVADGYLGAPEDFPPFPLELAPGVTYIFGIYYGERSTGAKSPVSNSNSLVFDDTPPPPPITSLRILAGSETESSLALAWDVTPAGASSIRIYYSDGNPESPSTWYPVGGRRVTLAGLSPGTNYTLYARVRNGGSPESAPSNSVGAATLPGTPGRGNEDAGGETRGCGFHAPLMGPAALLLGLAVSVSSRGGRPHSR